MTWAAVVIGLLAIGADLPSGISFAPDPTTKRPRTYMVSGGHEDLKSCELAKSGLIRFMEAQKMDVARAICIDQVDDGWITAVLK